ncbi:hypothetical protein RD110_11045 [Rhodoferax koreense]|uniref:Uncharacterized protein n=1 Tax=Rhodoferax koreensis TaxID=1842727 RepID=A0A1P8JV91_9BURK|nr:hypothetical protein [Rhodoferax koreense]APW37663.1 hypothetical protein RD110_11045 [Rhodoferax koreense]
MKYFKNPANVVYAFEADGSQDAFIGRELKAISKAEADALSQPAAVAPQPRQFTSLELLDLFTAGEQLSVATAAMTNPQVKLWYDRLLAAQYVTIADQRTRDGLSALVAMGLLTAERKASIVAAMEAT